MQLIHARFDIVDRGAKPPLKARFFVKAKLALLFDDGGEMPLVLPQRRLHRLDLAGQIWFADGQDVAVQRIDVGGNGLGDLDLAVRLLDVIAQQEVFFGPSAFQQLDLDLAAQLGDGPRAIGSLPVFGNGLFAIHMDAADQNDADPAKDADHGDFVGEP
jgi:hypothetical protein